MEAAWTTIAGNPSALSALVGSVIAVAGILLAAVASIAGIGLNNYFHARRLDKEQEHDRQQRELERERAVRKEIFIDAYAAMIQHLNAVQSFANLEVDIASAVKIVIECAPVIAKASLVCSDSTAKAISDIAPQLISLTHRLAMLRMVAEKDKREMVSTHDELKKLAATLNANPVPNLVDFTNAGGSLDWWERKAQEQKRLGESIDVEISKNAAALKAFLTSNFVLMTTMQEESMRIRTMLRPLIQAVRVDIGYPASEQTLDALFAPIQMPSREAIAMSLGIEEAEAKRLARTLITRSTA